MKNNNKNIYICKNYNKDKVKFVNYLEFSKIYANFVN